MNKWKTYIPKDQQLFCIQYTGDNLDIIVKELVKHDLYIEKSRNIEDRSFNILDGILKLHVNISDWIIEHDYNNFEVINDNNFKERYLETNKE